MNDKNKQHSWIRWNSLSPLEMSGLHSTGQQVSHMITLKPQSSDQDLAGVLLHWSSFHRPRQTGLASYLETANETGELVQVHTYISFKLIFINLYFEYSWLIQHWNLQLGSWFPKQIMPFITASSSLDLPKFC